MSYCGHETYIEVTGNRYRLSRYSRKLARELAEWVTARIGNPLAALRGKLEGFPSRIADSMIDNAKALADEAASLYSSRFWAVWQSLPGKVFELGLLLRQYHPSADPDEIYWQACMEHGDDYLPQAIIRTIGTMPADEAAIERECLEGWGLLPKLDQGAGKAPGPDAWLAVDKALLKGFNLKPAELDEMTITEIMVLVASMRAEAEGMRNNEDKLSLEEAVTWAKAQKQLSPAQRLQIALRQTER